MTQGPSDRQGYSQGHGHVIPGEIVESGIVDHTARSYDPQGGDVRGSSVLGPLSPGAPQHAVTVAAPQPAGPFAAPMPMPPLPEKSVGLAFLLTFLFGPLGMLYSTVTGALILLGITLVLSFGAGVVIALISLATLGLGSFLVVLAPLVGLPIWITSMIWGCLAASGHNERVRAQHAQHAHAYAQYGAAFAQQNAQRPANPGYGAPRW